MHLHYPLLPGLEGVTPHLLKPVIVALAYLFANMAQAQSLMPGSAANEQAKESFNAPLKLKLSLPTYLTADTIVGDEQNMKASGKVELLRGQQKVLAPNVQFNALNDEVQANEGVVYYQDKNVFKAPELKVNLSTEQGYAPNVEFFYAKHNGRGTAKNLEMSPSRVHTLSQAQYTTCKPGQQDWLLSAKTITLDNNTETGSAEQAVFTFLGVPILALPRFDFPIGNERRSGVLSPSVGYSSGTGLDLSVPYYFNLAHNHDLTMNTRLMARRGLQLSGQDRYLFERSVGDVRLEAIAHDNVYSDQRWGLFAHHTYRDNNLSAGWNLERVSDNSYFSDLSRTVNSSTQTHLPMELWARYKPGWGSVDVRATQYQTLQDTSNSITPAYNRLPSVHLNLNPWLAGQHALSLTAELTQFKHKSLVEGLRMNAAPTWAWGMSSDAAYLKTRSTLDLSSYRQLTSNTYTGAQTLNRAQPVFSADTGLVFERSSTWFSEKVKQTLEPRLFYLYAPFRDQAAFPNFDTASSDFGFAQIFSENVFNGKDRIADANHLTAAVSSRWLSDNTQSELFRFTLGKRYYFTPQKVQLSGPAVLTSASASDWLLAASGRLGEHYNIDFASQYDQTAQSQVKNSLTLKYAPQDKRFISLSKRFTKDTQSQVDLAWQWRLNPTSSLMGRVNYSLGVASASVNKGLTETLIGYEFDAGCWVFRVAANRYATSNATKNTSLYFQLDFSGLSHIGAGSLDTIKRNVPGYTPFESKPQWTYDPFLSR